MLFMHHSRFHLVTVTSRVCVACLGVIIIAIEPLMIYISSLLHSGWDEISDSGCENLRRADVKRVILVLMRYKLDTICHAASLWDCCFSRMQNVQNVLWRL